MSNCQNCYNGCTETISDQCIKYTGIDIPNLGIKTGDSLSLVQQALLTANGKNTLIDLSNVDICNLVQNYLPAQPSSETFTLYDILSALTQASCSTQTQLSSNYSTINALIDTQAATFADENSSMASLISTISATIDDDRSNTAALITTETLARVTANTAMASLITTLSGEVTTANANISGLATSISNIEVGDNSALVEQIDQLSASFSSGNAAALAAAQAAQTAANTATSSANTANLLLTEIASDSKLSPFEKQQIKLQWETIVSEKIKNDAQADSFGVSKTAYGTAYTTLSNYITPLLANLSNTSDIVGETFRTNFKNYYDARTDLLNAIASKAKALADGASAAITTESITRATAVSALSSRIDEITASGTDLTYLNQQINAAIVTEREATIAADLALATQINTLSASIVDPTAEINAAISTAETAAVTREQAIASNVASLTSTVNGHTSSINTNQSAIADINGNLSASYGLVLDANGHIASMNLLADGETGSSVVFSADTFQIFNGTSAVSPFTVVDGNVIMTGTTVVDSIITPGDGPAIGQPGWNGLSLNQGGDNLLEFRHPNGVLGMELGIIDEKLVLNWYDTNGVLIWKGGSNGLTALENSAAAYAGQITNVLRIDVDKNGIISYEGDILLDGDINPYGIQEGDDISYTPRTGAVPSTWTLGVTTAGSPGLNSYITVGLKNPNPNNKFRITLSTTDGYTGNVAAVPATAIKGYEFNSIIIYDGLSDDTGYGITRSIYVEISTTKY